jgi:hypothetical protein
MRLSRRLNCAPTSSVSPSGDTTGLRGNVRWLSAGKAKFDE